MPSVVPATPLLIETVATDPASVWDISRLMLAQWEPNGVELSTSWPVNLSLSASDLETRWSKGAKPTRTIKFEIQTVSPRETWLLLNLARRMGVARSIVPIVCDVSDLTMAAVSGATSISCDTTLRRLFVGGQVVVVQPSNRDDQNVWEHLNIASMSSGALTFTGPLVNNYTANARVYPIMTCDVVLEATLSATHSGAASATILAKEVAGPSALLPTAGDGATVMATYTPTGSSTAYPIFEPAIPWQAASPGFKRNGKSSMMGRVPVYALNGSRPRQNDKRTFTALSRADLWPLVSQFDACLGSLHTIVGVSAFNLFSLVTFVDSTHVTVTAMPGPLQDWTAYPLLAVQTISAGVVTTYISAIAGVTRASGVDTIALSDALPSFSSSVIKRVTTACFAKLGNELTEKWGPDGQVDLEFAIEELPGMPAGDVIQIAGLG